MTHSTGRVADETEALGVAEPFDSLDSRARRDVLHATFDRLQMVESQSVVVARSKEFLSGKYDIVGSLPFEIVLEIVKYLDPNDIVRNQRVSKRWRSIFSSDGIVEHSLRRALTLFHLGDNDLQDVANAMVYFRWQHALEYGRPVKKLFLPWSKPLMPFDSRMVSYHSRRLFYQAGHSDRVEMLDLETGERLLCPQELSEHTTPEFRVSDYYVVVGSNDYLVAWNMHSSETCERDLPCEYHHSSLHKDKVVIVNLDWGYEYPVYIWDLSSDRFQEIGTFSDLWLWHVDADKNILVTFEIDCDTDPAEVQQTKWTLTGDLLDRKHFHLSLSGREVDRQCLENSQHGGVDSNFCCIHTFNHKTIRRLRYNGNCTTLDLVYDGSVDKLSIRWNNYDHFRDPDSDFYAFLTPDISYHWRMASRRLEIFNADKQIQTMHQYQLHPQETSFRERLAAAPPRRDLTMGSRGEHYLHSFGDSEVFGLANDDGIQLWFFNPNFTPDIPGAVPFLPMEESG
ncbi:hypothetical protein VTN49DRAFT_3177 [Thermomyces lanuginosus]|uniref:uncharacterized protein n=1 Tax=Thermomyces lanuginosus TaxID=5541 RepID=UPI003743B3D4